MMRPVSRGAHGYLPVYTDSDSLARAMSLTCPSCRQSQTCSMPSGTSPACRLAVIIEDASELTLSACASSCRCATWRG